MKHAYLIMAHNEPEILQLLLSSLDDERNDIYVHIDRKASFDASVFRTLKSHFQVLPIHIDACWGDFSLVEIELALFKEAYSKGSYAYYHLLSGVDLPIKSQDYIHNYMLSIFCMNTRINCQISMQKIKFDSSSIVNNL